MESSASSSTSEVFQPVLQQTGLPLSVYPRLPPPPPAPGSSSGVPAIIITAPNGEVVGEQHHPARLEAAPVGPPSLPLLPPPEALLQRSSEVAGHPSPSASQVLASSPFAEPQREHSSSTAHVPSTSVLSFPHVIAFSSLPSTEDQGPTAASGLMSLVPSMDEVPLPIAQASRPMSAVPSAVRGSPLVLHVPNSTVEAPTLEAPVALVAAVPPSVVPTAATLNLAPLPPTHALPAVLVPPPADAPAAPEAAIPSVVVVPPPPLPVMPLGLPPMVPRSASLPSTSDDDLVSVHAATAMDLGMAPAPPAAVSRGDAPSMEAPRVPTSRRASSASTSHSTQHVDPKQQIMCPAVVTLPIRRTRNDWERVQGNKLFGSSSDEASEPDEGTSDAFPLGTPRSVTTAFRNESERGVSRSRSKKQRRHERKHRKVITENQVHEMDSYSATTSSSLGLSQESGSDRRAQRDAEGSTLAAAVPPPDFVPTIKDFPAAMDVPLESMEVVESRPPCGPIATLIAQCADNDLSGAWEGLGPAASPSPVELGLDSSTSVLSDTTECALLSLTIQGMSGLHADVSVVHPFVRVWLVHCLTGENLLTAPLAEEVACGVTFPFDLRLRRSRAPWWDTELLLPLNMERVRQAPKEGVLLFEVLDCGNETINGFFLPRNGIYPICWGFTMLYDCYGKLNISDDQQMHVQMFPYPMRAPWYMQLLQQVLPTSWSFAGASAPSEVHMEGEVLFSHADTSSNHYTPPVVGAPDIFHIFKNPMFRKVRYEAGLVFVAKRPKVYPIGYKPKSADMQPYEVYLLDLLAKGFRCSVLPLRPTEGRRPSIARSPVQNRRHVSFAVAATGNDYVRRAGERTLPPTTILQTCTVPGKVTCMDFSHSGLVLALGITHDLQHYVELRNPSSEGATVLNQLRGHVGHIHRVFFRADDEQLFSCSSDKTVMIWQVSVAHVSECVVAACTRVCVLPHAYPIYSCTVHQNRVLTAGYHSEIITWDIDRPEKVSEIQSSHSGSGLPDVLQRFIFDTNLHNSGTWVEDELLVGQIISRVSSDEKAVVLCVASNETGNRVWSVSSSGKVCCWRAKHETHRGENVWQMSIRKSVQCDGASDIQFRLDRVLVSCGTLPVIYIFDASSCAKLSTVRIEPSGVMPICLLPDGQAFIEGVSNGKLHAWECASGHCCTAKDGYAKVRTAFPIEEMVWASSKQMGALRSPAPCPTDLLPDLNGENPSQAKLVAPRDGVQLPLEQTAITIVGTSRKDGFIIINDIAAAREFRQMFDGETEGTPSVQSKGSNSQHQRRKRKSARSESSAMPEPVPDLHDTSEVDDHLSLTTSSMFEQQFMDTNFRINRIIGYWKSLVGKHRAPQSESEEVPSSLIGSTPRIISPIPISVANSVGVTPRSYVDVDDV